MGPDEVAGGWMDHEVPWLMAGHLLVGHGEPLQGSRQGTDVARSEVYDCEKMEEL